MSEEITISAPVVTEEQLAAVVEAITTVGEGKLVPTVVKFNFKKTKDDEGNTLIKEPIDFVLPYLTTDGLISIIETGGPALAMLLDAANSVITAEVRGMLSEDDTNSLSAATLDLAKLDWEFIANKPKATRGGGVSKEQWEAFFEDYLVVMPDVTGKSLDKIENMVGVFRHKLNKIATNKPILKVVLGQLAIYMEASESAAEHAAAVEFLINKADKLINADDTDLLEAL